MKKFALFTLAATMFSAFSLKAQDEPAGKLTVSGYVDVYFSHNFNNPPFNPNTNATPGAVPAIENPGRIFDIKNNQFSLGLVQTKFAYTTDKSEVVLDLTYGPNAALGQFGNLFGTDINIKQAYMAYKATDKLTFTVGQFGTHVGYELIDAPLNYNYSLSYLFGNGPFYHTGAKASYMFSDHIGLMAGIVNGWDGMYDFNKSKDAIAQLYIKPTDGFNIYLNYIGGNDANGFSFPTTAAAPNGGGRVLDTMKTPAHLFDITTTYQLTDNLLVGLNAAYGMGRLDSTKIEGNKYGTAKWGGAAIYAQYAFSDVFSLGLRAEYFNDKYGVRYISNTFGQGCYVNEYTLTGNIKLKDGHFNLKPEFRIDVAHVNDDANGTAKGYTKYSYYSGGSVKEAKSVNIQPTLALSAIYSF